MGIERILYACSLHDEGSKIWKYSPLIPTRYSTKGFPAYPPKRGSLPSRGYFSILGYRQDMLERVPLKKELAEAIGDVDRVVCFTVSSWSFPSVRILSGLVEYDYLKHCLQCIKQGTGTSDAPRAFLLQLRDTTVKIVSNQRRLSLFSHPTGWGC